MVFDGLSATGSKNRLATSSGSEGVFDGLSATGRIQAVRFVEAKTGRARLGGYAADGDGAGSRRAGEGTAGGIRRGGGAMRIREMVAALRELQSVPCICPCCGELFRLSEARLFCAGPPGRTWLVDLQRERERLDR